MATAVLAVVYVVQRRGGDETAQRREAVSAYIVEVNQTQQTLIIELERVSQAYRQLQLKPDAVPGQLQKVERAEGTLRKLRARLAALTAPPEARKLRARLLRLVDLQASLAHEVAGMVRYLPTQAGETRRVTAATRRLRDGLAEAKTVDAQREVFLAYEDAIGPSVRRLRSVDAPAVFEPSRTGEIARLSRLLSLSKQVRSALEAQEADEIDRLFARFVQTSASVGTTKPERRAVIAFNKRLAGIAEQRAAVAAERSRLDLDLR